MVSGTSPFATQLEGSQFSPQLTFFGSDTFGLADLLSRQLEALSGEVESLSFPSNEEVFLDRETFDRWA